MLNIFSKSDLVPGQIEALDDKHKRYPSGSCLKKLTKLPEQTLQPRYSFCRISIFLLYILIYTFLDVSNWNLIFCLKIDTLFVLCMYMYVLYMYRICMYPMWTCLLAKYIIIVLTCFYKSGLWENVENFIIILCTLFVLIGSHIDELLEGPFCTMHFSTKVWYWATTIFCRCLSKFICSNDDDEWSWSEKAHYLVLLFLEKACNELCETKCNGFTLLFVLFWNDG